MSDTQLYLGLDLGPEYTQLSYYNVDTREPESVYHKEARDTYMLPNIMFYSAYNKKSDDGQSEAYKFRGEGFSLQVRGKWNGCGSGV